MARHKTDHSLEHSQIIRKSLPLFFIIFITFAALLGGPITAAYHYQTSDHLEDVRTSQRYVLTEKRLMLELALNTIKNDVVFLVQLESLHRWLRSGAEQDLSSLVKDFSSFSTARKIYDQVRYLDGSGMEEVRINLKQGVATRIPHQELQNKKDRYYFIETMALDPGQFYISPLDLNMEHGQIEIPLKPTLRVGAPVFDAMGRKHGLVVLNFLAGQLIEQIRNLDRITTGQTILLNDQGYWLIGPDPDKEWGFMFQDKQEVRFSNEYPLVWASLTNENSGQILNEAGLFTFVSLYPAEWTGRICPTVNETSQPKDEHASCWKLISFVSRSVIDLQNRKLTLQFILFGAALLLTAATMSWYLALFINRRRFQRNELDMLAHHDVLTGLPNRRLFEDRLDVAIRSALRYRRQAGLLFIDLDGFKQVNDTMGHDAGDELLRKVAARFLAQCRKADTVSRLGGDEFGVILPEVSGPDGAVTVANNLINSLSRPFDLQPGSARVGASIGVALCPEHGKDSAVLLKKADEAMYASKADGKNMWTLAKE